MLKTSRKIIIPGGTVLVSIFLLYSLSILYKNLLPQHGSPASRDDNCNLPVTYSAGSFDQNFGISRDDFIKAMQGAERVWENPLGINLFDFDENGSLKVNLVFDERQAETKRIKEALDSIGNDKDKYDAVKSEYDNLSSKLEKEEADYEENLSDYNQEKEKIEEPVSSYKQQVKLYEKDVNYWNSRGGAPEEEYEKLKKEKKKLESLKSNLEKREDDLKKTYDSLEQDRKDINEMIDEVNTLAGILNRLAARVNLEVVNINKIKTSRDEFTTGLYRSDSGGQAVDIYQFFDEEDLVLILAHEFGHAIGLDHTDNPNSIMYPQLGEQEAKLADEDIMLFKEACSN